MSPDLFLLLDGVLRSRVWSVFSSGNLTSRHLAQLLSMSEIITPDPNIFPGVYTGLSRSRNRYTRVRAPVRHNEAARLDASLCGPDEYLPERGSRLECLNLGPHITLLRQNAAPSVWPFNWIDRIYIRCSDKVSSKKGNLPLLSLFNATSLSHRRLPKKSTCGSVCCVRVARQSDKAGLTDKLKDELFDDSVRVLSR